MKSIAAIKTEFLSTPSARRATSTAGIPDHLHGDFYPRPPRGGRPAIEGDKTYENVKFLSTPSARRATFMHRESST